MVADALQQHSNKDGASTTIPCRSAPTGRWLCANNAMSAFTDPVPLDPSDPNYMFLANNYLQELFFVARNLALTNGAITNGAKVGNLNARWVVFTSNGSANTEDAVTHSLGRVPRLIIPCEPDK